MLKNQPYRDLLEAVGYTTNSYDNSRDDTKVVLFAI